MEKAHTVNTERGVFMRVRQTLIYAEAKQSDPEGVAAYERKAESERGKNAAR